MISQTTYPQCPGILWKGPLLAQLKIVNPKISSIDKTGRAGWYHYYAGYSGNFVSSVLRSANVPATAIVVDPWNGSGTTTSAAASQGFQAYGFDLNPVMAIIAKARLLRASEAPSLIPLSQEIVAKLSHFDIATEHVDPLSVWLTPRAAATYRKIERATHFLLIDRNSACGSHMTFPSDEISSIAAFFYTAIFRSVRHTLKKFFTSNPTWTKRPRNKSQRARPTESYISKSFLDEVAEMTSGIEMDLFDEASGATPVVIKTASSGNLPLESGAADLIIASPPYCTRIDYAVATMPELAVLGHDLEQSRRVRESLIGTSTVGRCPLARRVEWGETCNTFLDFMTAHPSKASNTYYYKNHLQYFDGIYRSVLELGRILKPGGQCILVVQDSYYKEIRNDIPRIFLEMGRSAGFELQQRVDFGLSRTMAGIHPAARSYRHSSGATESVLCFAKP